MDKKKEKTSLEKNVRDKLSLKRGGSSFIGGQEIRRILEYINDPESPLSWLAKQTPEEQLEDWIIEMLETDFPDRKLLSQLTSNNYKYDYSVLTGTQISMYNESIYKDEIRRFNEEVNKRGYDDCLGKLSKKAEDYISAFRFASDDLEDLKKQIISVNDQAYRCMMDEKELAKQYGLKSLYPIRIKQYSDLVLSMLSHFLYKLILKSYIVEIDYLSVLENILSEELSIENQYNNSIQKKCEEEQKETVTMILDKDNNRKTVSDAPQVLALVLQNLAFLRTLEDIEFCLETENHSHGFSFGYDSKFKDFSVYGEGYNSENDFLKDLFKNKNSGGHKYAQHKTIRRFICNYNQKYGNIGNPDDVNLIYLIYMEIYKYNSRPSGYKTPQNIVKRVADNMSITKQELFFLDCKLERSFFARNNRLREYWYYCHINRVYRDTLKWVYLLPKETDAYEVIKNSFDEIVRIIAAHFGQEVRRINRIRQPG